MGIWISDNLNWNKQIETCAKKGKSRLGLVKRTLGTDVCVNAKKTCFVILVRPVLEYAAPLWNNCNQTLVQMSESVQHQATKFILNVFQNNYKDRLLQLEILPLSYRREMLDIVHIYNAFQGLNDYDFVQSIRVNNLFNLRASNNMMLMVVNGNIHTEKVFIITE